eukprot:2550042-Amphidinium_carterae.1
MDGTSSSPSTWLVWKANEALNNHPKPTHKSKQSTLVRQEPLQERAPPGGHYFLWLRAQL